ncbi:Imm10 family immunity protein [Kribbella sp. NBC_01245]|uniref:Imm10 family immunity protein n=1 Tax=Kribbella sp. NBC_01245 TaxID=2903578 RepID=UPI002E2A4FB2|nr:Imm10 family immunity protein [Kribbella sp. NBC_01245]
MKAAYTRDAPLNYEAVVFLDESSGTSFELQRALEFDAQDAALGLATYCLSNTLGATHYGGVETWNLTPGSLTLSLSGEAAKALNLPRTLQLHADAEELDQLGHHIRRILSS